MEIRKKLLTKKKKQFLDLSSRKSTDFQRQQKGVLYKWITLINNILTLFQLSGLSVLCIWRLMSVTLSRFIMFIAPDASTGLLIQLGCPAKAGISNTYISLVSFVIENF